MGQEPVLHRSDAPFRFPEILSEVVGRWKNKVEGGCRCMKPDRAVDRWSCS